MRGEPENSNPYLSKALDYILVIVLTATGAFIVWGLCRIFIG